MPKRKSNVNRKPKPKTKTRTRTLSKKSGFKKSTKIIIGVVCVLAIAGIVVGVLVSKRIISSDDNTQDISRALPPTTLMTLDSNLINNGIENFSINENDLMNNYIKRFRLIFAKIICEDYIIIDNITKFIDDTYSVSDSSDPYYLFSGDYYITLRDNTVISPSSTQNVFNMYFNYITIIKGIFDSEEFKNNNKILIKYLNILGNMTIDQIREFKNIEIGEKYKTYINKIYYSGETMIDSEEPTEPEEPEEINIDFNRLKKIFNNSMIISKDFKEKLMTIKKIKVNNEFIEIQSLTDNDLSIYEYKDRLLNELYNYYIYSLNYEYIKLKYLDTAGDIDEEEINSDSDIE